MTIVALSACSSHAPPRAERPKPAEPLAIPAGVIDRGGTLLIGDLHGTREIPDFVGRVVTTLAADRPVVLALEVPAQDTPSADAYLASDGGAAAKRALLADPFWREPFQDGRRSVAMADLFELVRALRAHGARVELARFDGQPTEQRDDAREELLANNVLAVRKAHPDAALVVYAGNLHTMRKTVEWRPGYVWMAGRLAQAGMTFVTLAPRYSDGSAWTCRDDVADHCGPGLMPGVEHAAGIHLETSKDGTYDGWFGVGAITASPPAAFPERAVGLDAKLAALRNSPDAVRVHALRAAAANDYAGCVAEYEHITEPTGEDAYNHACCLARLERKDAAFERLQFAFAHGFTDADHAANDPDLASLHADPRWPPKKSP